MLDQRKAAAAVSVGAHEPQVTADGGDAAKRQLTVPLQAGEFGLALFVESRDALDEIR